MSVDKTTGNFDKEHHFQLLNSLSEAKRLQEKEETQKVEPNHTTTNKKKMHPIDVMVTVTTQTAFAHLVNSLRKHPQLIIPNKSSDTVVNHHILDDTEIFKRAEDQLQFQKEMKELALEHERTQSHWTKAKLSFVAWLKRIGNDT